MLVLVGEALQLWPKYSGSTQMVPDLFGSSHGVPGEKQFLKHYRINREANTTIRFGGKQLCCGRVASENPIMTLSIPSLWMAYARCLL